MKHEYLNGGQPLPAGHQHAGEIGIVLDFEDGRPHPQKIYAADAQAMTLKLLGMYGNTQARLTEEKMKTRATPRTPETPPATPPPSTPTTLQPLSIEQRMQATVDLGDPAKSGKALLTLVRAETGIDLQADAVKARNQTAVKTFMDANPDFIPNRANGTLLRDRAYTQHGEITAESLQSAFDELKELGVLQSASQEQTPSSSTAEPSAQQQPRTGGNVASVRPSSLGGTRRSGEESKLTWADYVEMASTPEYEDRFRNEPGFSAKVNKAHEEYLRRAG